MRGHSPAGGRGVGRPDDPEAKAAPVAGIAHEAAKRSGNPWRMESDSRRRPPHGFNRRSCPRLLVVASLADSPAHPRRILEDWSGTDDCPPGGGADRTRRILPPPNINCSRPQVPEPSVSVPHVLRVGQTITAALAVLQSALRDIRIDRNLAVSRIRLPRSGRVAKPG